MNTNLEYLQRLRRIMPWGNSTCSKAAVWPPEEPLSSSQNRPKGEKEVTVIWRP